MKHEEMLHIIEKAFCGTVDFNEEITITGDHFFVATFVDSSGTAIGSNSAFNGFFAGRGITKHLAIIKLYITIRASLWAGVRQIDARSSGQSKNII